jgi:hypothetical protein
MRDAINTVRETSSPESDRRSGRTALSGAGRLRRRVVYRIRRNWIRELWDWARCGRVSITKVRDLAFSLDALNASSEHTELLDRESPIFVLATGWRSGSTLLQRILVTDPKVLLWGEPLGEMAMLSRISEMLSGLSTSPDIGQMVEPGKASLLATSWIATLGPPGFDFRRGLQGFLIRWLGEPAYHRGFHRWGFKEVRLGAAEATLLHWVFPKAKFVLLSRSPYDCYRSLADSGWHHLYHSRPEVRVDSAAGIARHWNRLALSWLGLPKDFPVYRIKYEDVVEKKVDFRDLEAWLGIKLNEELALSVRVGSTAWRRRLGACERWIIGREARAGMRALGYSEQG